MNMRVPDSGLQSGLVAYLIPILYNIGSNGQHFLRKIFFFFLPGTLPNMVLAQSLSGFFISSFTLTFSKNEQ